MMYSKITIKEKWGKYCDTDTLVDNMMALLTKYNHRNSEYGVCKILDTYFTRKEPLIKLFAKSPNYSGDMRIITQEPFARDCVRSDINKLIDGLRKSAGVKACILKYKDENGKTLNDYINTGATHMTVKNMASAKNILQSAEVSKFSTTTGATKESDEKATQFDLFMEDFSCITSATMPHAINIAEKVTIHQGMKTSRAFNKVCSYYGVDKWNKYNKEFAKYSDMVSGKERQLWFIISLNPLDYLTMSFGKSWGSCHTIDKTNRRRVSNGYSGAYCNGVLSYMLDKSSMVTFALDNLKENFYEDGRLYRCMFHMNLDTCKFIQGRIYPQGNDGSTDLYKKFRLIIENEFTPLLGLRENKWKATAVDSYGDVSSEGYHYKDYTCFESCRTFYPTEKGNIGRVNIGSIGICPHCGKEFSSSSNLSHNWCEVPTPVVTLADEIAAINTMGWIEIDTSIITTTYSSNWN